VSREDLLEAVNAVKDNVEKTTTHCVPQAACMETKPVFVMQ